MDDRRTKLRPWLRRWLSGGRVGKSTKQAGSSVKLEGVDVVVHAQPRLHSGVELGGEVLPSQAAALHAENARLENEVKRLTTLVRNSSASIKDKRHSALLLPPELDDLRDRAAAAVGRARAHSLERARELQSGASLPEALRQFKPLAEEEAVKEASKALPALELAVAHAPNDASTIEALSRAVEHLARVTQTKVAERTQLGEPDLVLGLRWKRADGPSDAVDSEWILHDSKLESALTRGQTVFSRQEVAAFDFGGVELTASHYVEAWEEAFFQPQLVDASSLDLVVECQAAIAAGNRDFQVVYDGVWRVIESGETHTVEACRAAILQLRGAVSGQARQRKEAASPATLLADAALAKPAFDVLVRLVSEHTGARLELATLGERTTGLKKVSRVVEKVALRPGEGRGQSDAVCDVVRAMLVAMDMATIAAIADAFASLAGAGIVRIVRIKDRFATPSAGGWRDLMVNLIVEGDARGHVCEVQIAHEMMLTARKGLPGHAIYALVRNASELIESCGRERELRIEAVRALQEAGRAIEVVRCGADAGSRTTRVGGDGGRVAALATSVTADEEGRVESST